MKLTIGTVALFFISLIGSCKIVRADNQILTAICTKVDCLNNFTAKTGWSFSQRTEYTGGFTDLEQNWYLSPAAGFDVPISKGVSVGQPLLDLNAVFKLGKLMSDKIPVVHDLANSDPFLSGILGKLTIGETGTYDYSNGRWLDISWVGANIKF